MTIYDIKNRIKHNKHVAFYVEGYGSILMIERLLLKNGYVWQSNPDGKFILNTLDRNNSFFDKLWFYINCEFNKPKEISITCNLLEESVNIEHVIHTSNFSGQELNNLFIFEPSYKPKRIERTI
jgi:hypothetical protein